MIKIGFFSLSVLFALFSTGCSRSDECDPNRYCEQQKLDSSFVTVKVTYATGVAVPIEMYEGYIDDGTLYFRDTLYENKVTYYLPSDKRYSARAYYKQGAQTIIATDGGKVAVKTFWNCDERCYKSRDLTLELELLQ
ncbi:MAG: hypothetical protein ACK4K0_03325 [Flavobacteriales bacterium]